MGKKNEINPFTVSELQILRGHCVANPADRTRVIQSDRGIAGENIHILGNGHAQVTLSSRCVGVAVWGCASNSRRLVLPAMVGSWHLACFSVEAHMGALRGTSAIAERSESHEGPKSIPN